MKRLAVSCEDRMHILAIKNKDKQQLKDIFDRNEIMWREHGEYISGRTPEGVLIPPDDPDLVAYIELLMAPQ